MDVFRQISCWLILKYCMNILYEGGTINENADDTIEWILMAQTLNCTAVLAKAHLACCDLNVFHSKQ